jgi:hypothetical protein
MERHSRKYNSVTVIQRIARRERRERKRKRGSERGRAVWGWRWTPALSLMGT